MAEATAPTTGESKNCPSCKKPMKRKKRYYKNGHYYCNKNCWMTASKAAAATATEQKAAA